MAKVYELYEILSGPSKYDFVEALSHRKSPPSIKFTLQRRPGGQKEERRVCLHLVGKITMRESPSKEDHDERRNDPQGWSFYGDMEVIDGRNYIVDHVSVIGRYSTRARVGSLREVDQEEFDELKSLGLV